MFKNNSKTINADFDSENYKKARFHYLLQILFGESLAIDYSKTIAEFAPTPEARAFLLKQQADEERHLEMLTDYVETIDRPKVKISKHMRGLHRIVEKILKEKDYAGAVMMQNFIVEGLVIVLLKEMQKHGDETLKKICADITHDEISHVAFGVSQMRELLAKEKDNKLQNRLSNIQRRALIRSVLFFTNLAGEAKDLNIEWDRLAKETVEEHLLRIKNSGFKLTFYDSWALKFSLWFYTVV
jgi:1,2-phenylacetyl-CoA epoxidase catalytic subunit